MKEVSNLKITKVPIEQLSVHPHNARQGDIGAISKSLEEHGQYRPIVVQKSTMRVLAGNHTLQAAAALGWKHVEAVTIDVDDDQALRILLVDNRTNDLADYDNGVLVDLLESLVFTDIGLIGTGFTGSDLDDLIANANSTDLFGDDGKEPDYDTTEKNLGDQYEVIIRCETEEQQRELLQRFIDEGLDCRGAVI